MTELGRKRWDLDFDVAKSIRYHVYRRSYFEWLDYFTKIMTLIVGMAAFASIVSDFHDLSVAATLFVSILAAIDIVIGFSTRARLHGELARKFSAVGQEIAATPQSSDVDIARWQSRRLELEADEPGIVDWLERRCAFEESKARGAQPRDEWQLSPFRWAMAPFMPF